MGANKARKPECPCLPALLAQKYLDVQQNIFLVIAPDQTVSMINKKGCELLGYKKEEIIGKDWCNNFLPSKIRKETRAVLEKVTAGKLEATEYHENPILTKSGKERLIAWHNSYLRDKKGKIISAISSGEDITEHRASEDALKESEERYATMVRQTNALIYDYNVITGRIVWAGNVRGLTGFMDSEFSKVGIDRWAQMVHPEDRGLALKLLEQAEKEKKRYLVQYRFLKKSGKYFWAQDAGVFLYDKKGKPYRMLGVMRDVSPIKETEMALQTSEEKYHTLVDQLFEGIVVAQGPKPRIIFANPSLSRILGYSIEEMLAFTPRKVMGLIHPEDREMFFSRFKARLEGRKAPPTYEFRGIRKDGKTIWVAISSKRIQYRGQPAVQATFTDITERQNAVNALRESEKKYRTLTENMNDVIYAIDTQGNLTYISPSVRQYGFSHEKMVSRRFTDFILPEDIKTVVENFQLSIRTGKEFSTMFRVRTKDGRLLWVEDNGKLQYGESGAIVGLTGTLRDITLRKQAEGQLKESEEKFRKIIESSHDLIMLTRPDGAIDYLSPACWNIIGWKPQDLVGKNISVAHPDDREKVTDSLSRAMKGESGSGLEYRVLTKAGTVRWVSHAWSPIMVGGNLHMIASVVQDITGRKKSQEKLLHQKEQIAQLSKMKERFMADMTHELKTPLSVIMLNLEMAKKLNPATQRDQLQSCFDLMWRNSLRLSRSIEQIMQLTKAESADLAASRFHLTDIIGEVCEEYLPLARTKGIRMEIGGPDIEIKGNKHFLAMAVSNLISNAIKFTPHGHINIGWASQGENAVISVADTGIGIKPGNLEKVFHKFFKEDHNSPGSGIGLAISADVIARMGGRMEFESTPGKGSTFRIIIPKEVSE